MAQEPMDIDDDAADAGEVAAEAISSAPPQVWRPEVHPLADGEELDYDRSAYDFIHSVELEWPCLSFSILSDSLGYMRKPPHTVYVATGSQAHSNNDNCLSVMKISGLRACVENSDDEGDDDEDEDNAMDLDPAIRTRSIPHAGAVNRMQSMPQNASMLASWADTGIVHLWNARASIAELDDKRDAHTARVRPSMSFRGHSTEGFAIDWSPVTEGALLTGDNDANIFSWSMQRAGAGRVWNTGKDPIRGHTASVEDVRWSPTEASYFASCSVDTTVKLWDVRAPGGAKASVVAHDSDVNVISWNAKLPHLLVSGGDDAHLRVWDLRKFSAPVFDFAFHAGPITSVEWSPDEDSMLAASSEDDSVTVWDLSASRDPSEVVDDDYLNKVPEALLFVHRGASEYKELHWHKQIPGCIVTTSKTGLHIFKPFNL